MSNYEYLQVIDSKMNEMYVMIESIYNDVNEALSKNKIGLSKSICERTKEVVEKEQEVLDLSVEALIRYRPFASDLRGVTVAMRISYDLSRVSRYLYNITQIIDEICANGCCAKEVSTLLEDGWSMVRQSMKAYFARDPDESDIVIRSDDDIDQRYRIILNKYKKMEGATGECILFNGLVARVIERMADHACYIAGETIYLTTAKRVGYRALKCKTKAQADG